VLEALLEPVKPDEDKSCMYKDRSGEHGNKVKNDLLVGVQQVKIHRVQSTLRSCTRSKEKSINVFQVVPGVDDDRGDEGDRDNIDIMNKDEVHV
jgi:hypothetical protein